MLRNGLTATAETPDPSRSDSHAWSAHPNYHRLATVAGLRPAEPGFRSIAVAPALGSLRRIEARMPHPKGPVGVRLRRAGATGITAEIALPPGLPGRFDWHGQTVPLAPGDNRVRCAPTCRRD